MITFIDGDLLECDCIIRCHQTNCRGKMDSGLSLDVKNKYRKVYSSYSENCKLLGSGLLGGCQFASCLDGTIMVSMFGQDDYGRDKRYTDYDALDRCIRLVRDRATTTGHSVAFPYRMGCVNGGGDWFTVLGIIKKYFDNNSIDCKIVKKV